METTVQVTPDNIMKVGLGFLASKTLLTAVELDLFTHLAKRPMTAAELTASLGLNGRGSVDFFDALVALQLLDRRDGEYRNRPDAETFLVRDKPAYIGGLLEMANARLYPFWGNLTTALQTGQPQNEAREGRDIFSELYADPQRLRGFLHAMTGISLGAAQALSARFPWQQYRTVVDVGTAQGGMVCTLAHHHSHLRGLGFDLPAVRPVFDEYVRSRNLQDRVEFQPGDFFKDSLPAADVVVMGHILHDWGLDDKKMLVKKAYDALPAGGAFIVYEAIIDDDRRVNATGLLMSLNMLIETRAGFDFTAADCIGWLREAGFNDVRVEPLTGPDSAVIAMK